MLLQNDRLLSLLQISLQKLREKFIHASIRSRMEMRFLHTVFALAAHGSHSRHAQLVYTELPQFAQSV